MYKAKTRTNPLIEAELIKRRNYLALKKAEQEKINLYNKSIPSYTNAVNKIIDHGQKNPTVQYVRVPSTQHFGEEENREQIKDSRYYNTHYRTDNGNTNYQNNSSRRITNSRIEVMNGSSKYQTRSEQDFHRSTQKLNAEHSNYNLLNFYADSPEYGLSNLTAAHNKAV